MVQGARCEGAVHRLCLIPQQGNRTAHFAAKGHEFISIRHAPEHLLEMLHGDVLN